MASDSVGPVGEVIGMGLREAISSIRADLLAARVDGESSSIRFPVERVTVELQVVATREGGGKAGFRVPFVNVELGGSVTAASSETSTVTVEFGAPVDQSGAPVKIAQESDKRKG